MIEVRGINKFFGKHQALHDVDFRVEPGEIVALMGANGAGKSTLFDILATVDPFFSGEAIVAGFDVRRQVADVRARLGYVPGRFSLYGDLTVQENLEFFARAYGSSPDAIRDIAPELWESLAPFTDLRAGNMSGGMKQKLTICCALVHHPAVLLLDEPTLGVDPQSRHDVWDALFKLGKKGVSILISTHYIDEAAWADKILLLHEGRKLIWGSPASVMASYENVTLKGPVRRSGARTLEDIFIHVLSTQNRVSP